MSSKCAKGMGWSVDSTLLFDDIGVSFDVKTLFEAQVPGGGYEGTCSVTATMNGQDSDGWARLIVIEGN